MLELNICDRRELLLLNPGRKHLDADQLAQQHLSSEPKDSPGIARHQRRECKAGLQRISTQTSRQDGTVVHAGLFFIYIYNIYIYRYNAMQYWKNVQAQRYGIR